MERIPNYNKQELCDAVYHAVSGAAKPLTRLEICRAIGRKKSVHIVAMIQALAAGGWLVEVMDFDKSGRPAYRYKIGQLVPNCEQVGLTQLA